MAKEKKPEEPKDDIPAWFMTYSDVITLLMTFFILLLTFATTEPERFEKSISATFSGGSATGTAGKKMDGVDRDSMVNRIRPPAARIAMRGAEMPPIESAPAKRAFGEGLRSLSDEEEKQNELTSHAFDVSIPLMFDQGGKLTENGKGICKALGSQLQALPFHALIQASDQLHSDKLTEVMEFLFRHEMVRPGQVAMSLVRDTTLPSDKLRIQINRFSQNDR